MEMKRERERLMKREKKKKKKKIERVEKKNPIIKNMIITITENKERRRR